MLEALKNRAPTPAPFSEDEHFSLCFLSCKSSPHEVVENTNGLHTFLYNFWVDFKLTAKHSPLCRPNSKCSLHHQPSPEETVIEDTLLWDEAATSREGPH
ncbi:hypothetical protein CRENBAI_019781 [Crenichthys baileyi]|uniref:Uncharacterized protein n=1 Tax=Crenichthys baileyi TaxID=28760 RepID=A0AAV9SIT0_9TELE